MPATANRPIEPLYVDAASAVPRRRSEWGDEHWRSSIDTDDSPQFEGFDPVNIEQYLEGVRISSMKSLVDGEELHVMELESFLTLKGCERVLQLIGRSECMQSTAATTGKSYHISLSLPPCSPPADEVAVSEEMVVMGFATREPRETPLDISSALNKSRKLRDLHNQGLVTLVSDIRTELPDSTPPLSASVAPPQGTAAPSAPRKTASKRKAQQSTAPAKKSKKAAAGSSNVDPTANATDGDALKAAQREITSLRKKLERAEERFETSFFAEQDRWRYELVRVTKAHQEELRKRDHEVREARLDADSQRIRIDLIKRKLEPGSSLLGMLERMERAERR